MSYVLIIESEEALRSRIGVAFADHGYQCRTAVSCADALTVLRISPPPVMIVVGPTVTAQTAEEFAALIRRHPFLAKIPLSIMASLVDGHGNGSGAAAAPSELDAAAWTEAVFRHLGGGGVGS